MPGEFPGGCGISECYPIIPCLPSLPVRWRVTLGKDFCQFNMSVTHRLKRRFSVCGAVFTQFPALCSLSPMEVAEQKFFMLFCIWTCVSRKGSGTSQTCRVTLRAPFRDDPSSDEQSNRISFLCRQREKALLLQESLSQARLSSCCHLICLNPVEGGNGS